MPTNVYSYIAHLEEMAQRTSPEHL